MSRDALIQLLATLGLVACLVGAAVMFPMINSQRRELQVSFDLQVGDRTEPKYVLAAAALGSFRGIAVDWLWYRSERLKQEGKHFEANNLAQWITILQPRFPKVWAFQAWNMAYNISVQTHTPVERWKWVSNGIDLLRNQGIPNNPNAIGLYRELGWIFFHKMGQTTDDMHWYYKRQMAREWQELLGDPSQGATTAQAIERFRPIAVAADRYLDFGRLTLDDRTTLRQLAEQYPGYREKLEAMTEDSIVRVADWLIDGQAALADDAPALNRALQPVRESLREQQRRALTDPLSLLYQDAPAAERVVEQIRDLGLDLDAQTARRLGRIFMLQAYTRSIEQLAQWMTQSPVFDEKDLGLLRILGDPQNVEGLTALMPFLRAKVLIDTYHMDPTVMVELMELYGPIDWRHPAAHGIYWSFLGVRKAGQLVNQNRIDYINTDRQVIHGLQELTRFGRVSYDPLNDYIDLLPDPRFIPGYEKAVYGSTAATEQADIDHEGGTVQSYKSGHENFLIQAVIYSYLYGDLDQAREYYERVRTLYGAEDYNVARGRYLQALDDFVLSEMSGEMTRQAIARPFIDAMIARALREGLANGRLDVFERFINLAKDAHANYQQSSSRTADAKTAQDRLALPPFRQVLRESYVQMLSNPSLPLQMRSRIYQATAAVDMELLRYAWPRLRAQVSAQAEQLGYVFEAAFPEPPGADEALEQGPREAAPEVGETLERQ